MSLIEQIKTITQKDPAVVFRVLLPSGYKIRGTVVEIGDDYVELDSPQEGHVYVPVLDAVWEVVPLEQRG